MEKADHDINKTEVEIANLKKTKLRLEHSPKKAEKVHVKHSAQSLAQMVSKLPCWSYFCLTLFHQVYEENKERASQANDELAPISIPEGMKPTPIQELEVYKANLEFHNKHRQHIVNVMSQRTIEIAQKQKDLVVQYRKLHESWVKRTKTLEETKPAAKSKKKGPSRGVCP